MNEIIGKALPWVRLNGVRIGTEALVNFVGPFLIYDLSKPSLGDVHALMASSAPPIGWSIIEFVRKRRVDALSMLVLTGIALSLLAFFGGGSAKFLQLRERMVTGLIGLIFLGSAAIGRPLIYQLARATTMRRSPSQLAELESLRDNVYFRRTMMVMTLVWGFRPPDRLRGGQRPGDDPGRSATITSSSARSSATAAPARLVSGPPGTPIGPPATPGRVGAAAAAGLLAAADAPSGAALCRAARG